jgi:ParB/RepB/Spo0J family partition protein
MQSLLITDLVIPEVRQRKKFDEQKIEDLAASIQDKGIMHPPVVRNDGKTLVAGHRRIIAMRYLDAMGIPIFCNGEKVPSGSIPVNELGDLSELQMQEAELEENLIRVDLSWQEEAAAMSALHQLRVAADPEQSVLDTAREIAGGDNAEDAPELSTTYKKMRDADLLKEHLDDPDVAQAKSAKEALKILRKKSQKQVNQVLAEKFEHESTEHTIINGDFREAIADIASKSVDVLLTDPPYGVGADKFGEQADASHAYDDSLSHALELVQVLAAESYRVCREEAHAYVFCDIRHWSAFTELFTDAGWHCWSTPIIWNKGNGMLPRPEHGPRRCYEAVLFASKGDKIIKHVKGDVINVPGLSKPLFGAEKPADLYADILGRSTSPGDVVLDCFAGAGPVIPACNSLSLQAIAIELNPEKYNHILSRVKDTITVAEAPPEPTIEGVLGTL